MTPYWNPLNLLNFKKNERTVSLNVTKPRRYYINEASMKSAYVSSFDSILQKAIGFWCVMWWWL